MPTPRFNTEGKTFSSTTTEGLTAAQRARVARIEDLIDFYLGYHWETMPTEYSQGGTKITENFCRLFVNKLVSFELGRGFKINFKKVLLDTPVIVDARPGYTTIYDYFTEFWSTDRNNMLEFCTDMGQMKSVTGEAWVKVDYKSAKDEDDIFFEYSKGRVFLRVMPSQYVHPEFDPHDPKKLIKLVIQYTYKKPIDDLGAEQEFVFRQEWTKGFVVTEIGDGGRKVTENTFGFIPFVQIKNFLELGSTEGLSDLADLYPLNLVSNQKMSDLSETIDYHSAPVTVIVNAAKDEGVERGPDKMWYVRGKDVNVFNLEQKSEMTAATNYISTLKTNMCEMASVPEALLGGKMPISNTSGIALQYLNAPIVERTRVKSALTKAGLTQLMKMIIKVSLDAGILVLPENISKNDLYSVDIQIVDTLPKDELLIYQTIENGMKLGIMTREKACELLMIENVEEYLRKVDEENAKHPEYFNASWALGLLNLKQKETLAEQNSVDSSKHVNRVDLPKDKGTRINSGFGGNE